MLIFLACDSAADRLITDTAMRNKTIKLPNEGMLCSPIRGCSAVEEACVSVLHGLGVGWCSVFWTIHNHTHTTKYTPPLRLFDHG